MTKEEAEKLAVEAVISEGSRIGNKLIWSGHFEENSRFCDQHAGWLVAVPLDVQKGIDTDMVFVEVFEPDGKINFPYSV